jgi:cytochrome c556
MRACARQWAARFAGLALGLGLLAAVAAAGDKPMVWKPIVPEADSTDLIKYLSQALQNDLDQGPPKGADEDAKKEWRGKVRNLPLLIAVLTQSTKGGKADQLATIRTAALQMSEAADKEQFDAEKAKATALASLKADPKASTEPVALDEKAELIDLMNLLRLREKGGLGFGEKPTPPASSDGIESRLMGWAKRAPAGAELAKQADDIARAAYIMAAISELTEAHTPKKKEGDKDPKDWKQWTDDMREGSLELATAARMKDSAAIKKAANKLNASCNNCHGVFRQ